MEERKDDNQRRHRRLVGSEGRQLGCNTPVRDFPVQVKTDQQKLESRTLNGSFVNVAKA
jgi:hypothetical protein